jgi:hypothetical protein
MKVGACLFVLGFLGVLGVFAFVDLRSSDALIEKPMIKIFNTFPTDGTVHKALNW